MKIKESNLPVKRCVKCGTELVEDMTIMMFGGGNKVLYCPNEKCERFGLQTWVYATKREKTK